MAANEAATSPTPIKIAAAAVRNLTTDTLHRDYTLL